EVTMNNWLHKFMKKPDISDNTDISDKPDISDKWGENLGNMPGGGPDKPDRLDPSLNLSGLSGFNQALFDKNLRYMPRIEPDITDKTDTERHLSGLSGSTYGLSGKIPFTFSNDSDLLDGYEERLAIAEYDGHQNSTQAQRIAYLDAFIAVLVTLPYEDAEG